MKSGVAFAEDEEEPAQVTVGKVTVLHRLHLETLNLLALNEPLSLNLTLTLSLHERLTSRT